MKRDPSSDPVPPSEPPLGGLADLFRLAFGDGLGGVFPFSAGAGLEALLNRVEAGR